MNTIDIEAITKAYGQTTVLACIDLAIGSGEFLTLLGPSGCGKSTLLRIIAGLEQQDRGHVRIGGRIVDAVPPRSRNVAMVFQNYALYPHMTVHQNLSLPLRLRRLSWTERVLGGFTHRVRMIEAEIAERVATVADPLGLLPLLDRKPLQLSGGQRQRAALGRAMVREPAAFLMDEPLSNLDTQLRGQLRLEISQLHRRLGATFVYVTHDQLEAMTMSDRVAVMFDGRIVQLGTPSEIYGDPVDLRVAKFVGSPPINLLPAELDDHGRPTIGGRLLADAVVGTPHMAVTIGVRAEAVRLTGNPTDISASVVYVENLGSDLLVNLVIGKSGERLVARIDPAGMCPAVDALVSVDFEPRALLVFDSEGRRLRRQAQSSGSRTAVAAIRG